MATHAWSAAAYFVGSSVELGFVGIYYAFLHVYYAFTIDFEVFLIFWILSLTYILRGKGIFILFYFIFFIFLVFLVFLVFRWFDCSNFWVCYIQLSFVSSVAVEMDIRTAG